MSFYDAVALKKTAEHIAKASSVLDKEDVGNVMKLCEVFKHHTKNKLSAFFKKADGRPVLYSYSCDSTPMKTSVRISAEGLAPNTSVDMRGKRCIEFLLQRGWYKTVIADCSIQMVPVLDDPRPLTAGKTSWHLFSAAKEFSPLLQERGHAGISISHYAFDRAIFSALHRKLAQRHELYHRRRETTGEAQDLVPKRLLDWSAGTGCAMHDAQNGLKWALAPYVESTDTIRDLHIAIESLRNSVYTLTSHLPAFLREALAFDPEPYDRDEVYEFWTALGVGVDMVHAFVDLNPVYSGGRLWVAASWESRSDLQEELTRIWIYLLRLRRFTESRWCTAGPSCRGLAACLAVGLEPLVASARRDPETSDFYISGFARLSQKVKEYLLRVSLVSYVPDNFLGELMEDDRVVKRLEVFETALTEELTWLEDLKPNTWRRIASIAGPGFCPRQFRSEVMHCGQVAASFITNKVLIVARGFPWCLARGDIDQKLVNLASLRAPPDEELAAKVYELMRRGAHE
jgi:hypothetical protein